MYSIRVKSSEGETLEFKRFGTITGASEKALSLSKEGLPLVEILDYRDCLVGMYFNGRRCSVVDRETNRFSVIAERTAELLDVLGSYSDYSKFVLLEENGFILIKCSRTGDILFNITDCCIEELVRATENLIGSFDKRITSPVKRYFFSKKGVERGLMFYTPNRVEKTSVDLYLGVV